MSMIDEWDIGVAVFSSYDADGWLQVQYDAFGEQDAGVAPYEVQSLAGLLHRPMDPAVDPNSNPKAPQASTVLVGMQGGLGRVFVLTDPRVVPLLPLLQKGETLLYSDNGSFLRMHADGTLSLVTTDTGDTTGQTLARTMSPEGGFNDYGPFGSYNFDDYGFRVTTQPGASFQLGYLGGAIPNMETSAYIGADQIQLDGLVAIGPQGTLPDQVVKLTPLITALKAMMSAAAAAAAPETAPAVVEAVNQALDAVADVLGTQTLIG